MASVSREYDLEPQSPDTATELYLGHWREGFGLDAPHRYRLESFAEWCEANDRRTLSDRTERDLHAYRVYRR